MVKSGLVDRAWLEVKPRLALSQASHTVNIPGQKCNYSKKRFQA